MPDKKYNFALISFILVLILPFFINLIFNHPTFDDFYYSEKARHFGYFDAQMKWYKYWTGKFFSTAVLSISPLYFRSFVGYDILVFLVNVMTPIAIYKLLSQITGAILTTSEKSLLTVSVYFVFLCSMPALAQGFYWLTGIFVYLVPILLTMLFFICYSKLSAAVGKSKRFTLIFIATIILVAITGSSEIAMVFIASLFVSFLLLKFKMKGKIDLYDIVFCSAIILGSYIIISAPGNDLRSETFPMKNDFLHSVILSATELAKNTLLWMFKTPLIPVTFLLMPIMSRLIRRFSNVPQFLKLHPLYYVITFLFVMSACTFAPVWSTGLVPFKRTQNVVSFFFVAGFMFLTFVFYFRSASSKKLIPDKFIKLSFIPVITILILLGFTKNNVRSSFADLITGTAYQYDIQMKQRYDYIRKNDSELIEVNDIKNIPRTFYFTDITTDKNFDLNIWYAQYFGKKSIALKKTDNP
ncbi:MAG: DUF6056 family protein [Ignavibacteria bacterium]